MIFNRKFVYKNYTFERMLIKMEILKKEIKLPEDDIMNLRQVILILTRSPASDFTVIYTLYICRLNATLHNRST